MRAPNMFFLFFCLSVFLSFCLSVFGANNHISTTGYILRGIFLVYENSLYLILLKPVQRRAGQKQCEESRAGLYPSLIVALITHFKLVNNTGYQPGGQIKVNFPEVWRPFPSFSFELEGLRRESEWRYNSSWYNTTVGDRRHRAIQREGRQENAIEKEGNTQLEGQ